MLEEGSVEEVRTLIKKLGADNQDVDHVKCASYAASFGNFKVLKYFIEELGVKAMDLHIVFPDELIPGHSDSFLYCVSIAEDDKDVWWEVVEYLLAKGGSFEDRESEATSREEIWMTTKQKCVNSLSCSGGKERLQMLVKKTGLEGLDADMLRESAAECRQCIEFDIKIANELRMDVEDLTYWHKDGEELASLLTSWADQIEKPQGSARSGSSRII